MTEKNAVKMIPPAITTYGNQIKGYGRVRLYERTKGDIVT